MTSPKGLPGKNLQLVLLSVGGAFITYFSMYAFRKPFTAGTFDGLTYMGIDYKVLLVIAQVIGYACSKFLGIKVISELPPNARIKYILVLIGISWLALLLFGSVPYPYNFLCLFFNGLPLGMIWGIVFAFLEGRRNTELLGAGMASSFIVASGAVKSVGRGLVLNGVSEFWMPFFTGMIFIPTLLLGVWMLSRIPPPTKEDELARTAREPMAGKDRLSFFLSFAPGIIMVTILYMALNGFRDFRDNFAVEIWNSLGFAEQPSILTVSEIPIAILVLLIAGLMFLVRSNRKAFYANFFLIGAGGLLVLITTWLFVHQNLNPAVWMISIGFGMYLAYIFYHTMLFERWIALFRVKSNIGFLMYICDSFGYLASVAILIYKNFYFRDMSWLDFFIDVSIAMGIITVVLSILAGIYFRWREATWRKRNLSQVAPEI